MVDTRKDFTIAGGHDFKFTFTAGLCKTPEVSKVACDFTANAARVRVLSGLPEIARYAWFKAIVRANAVSNATKRLHRGEGFTPEEVESIAREEARLFALNHEQKLRQEIDILYPINSDVADEYDWGPIADAIQVASGGKDETLAELIESVFAAMITGTWTAYEVLAGDLWEAAINTHPQGLANLQGNPEGNEQKVSAETLKKRAGKKSIPVLSAAKFGYDIAKKMGSALRGEYNFTTRNAIIRAYREAFWVDAGGIEEALSSQDIWKLSAVRNVLVHKNRVIDEEFIATAEHLPDFQRYKLGETFPLDGRMVHSLIYPATAKAYTLILAVDHWIRTHQDGKT